MAATRFYCLGSLTDTTINTTAGDIHDEITSVSHVNETQKFPHLNLVLFQVHYDNNSPTPSERTSYMHEVIPWLISRGYVPQFWTEG